MKKTISLILVLFITLSSLTFAANAVGLEDIYQIGDVNLDGELNIRDVTAIQKYIANMIEFTDDALSKADADYNLKINIRDASHIQHIIAKLYIPLTAKKGVDISKHNGDVDIKIPAAQSVTVD